MEEYQITKNKEIPERGSLSLAATFRHNLSKLEIGDSFAIPFSAGMDNDDMRNLTGRIHAAARAEKIKITTRRVIEEKQRVIRVWRIE